MEIGPGAADVSRRGPDSLHPGAAREKVLRLEGRELDLIVQGMWRTLLDHTCSVRATAQILEEIARARQFGKIDYCLVFQLESRSADAAAGSPEWAIHVVHASL